MDIIDLDGKVQKWQLTGHIAKGSRQNKSELHLQAREVIKNSSHGVGVCCQNTKSVD